MITYEALYEMLRKEKTFPELQKLPDTFYKDVSKYLKEKKRILESQKGKDSIFAETEIKKTKTQLENIKKILKELYAKRELKITQLAISASKSASDIKADTLLNEEEPLYEKILEILTKSRTDTFNSLLNNSQESEEPKSIKTNQKQKLIRFSQPVPKFVGTDLQTYGPFDKEDVCYIEPKIADLLIKKEKAEEI